MYGQSGTQTASAIAAGAGSPLNTHVDNVDDVYIAKNITEINVISEADESEFNNNQNEDLQKDCGCDTTNDRQVSRWTQTNEFICVGQQQKLRIADKYYRIDLRVNSELAKIIDNGGNLQDIADGVSRCLVRLEHNGDDLLSNAMTAWKMQTKEGMDDMFKEILACVREGSNSRKMCQLIEAAYRRNMLFIGIDIGSLVFLFRHVTDESAELAHLSEARQKDVQELLLEFLPSRVKEKEVWWQVKRCSVASSSEHGGAQCQLSEPIPFLCPQSGSVASVDYRHMEYTIQKVVGQILPSLHRHITKVQEEATQKQTDLLCGLIQQANRHGYHQTAVAASVNFQNPPSATLNPLFHKTSTAHSDCQKAGYNLDDKNARGEGEGVPSDLSTDGGETQPIGMRRDFTFPKKVERGSEGDFDDTRNDVSVDLGQKGELLDCAETKLGPKKSQESKMPLAEQLLDWVNVKSRASQSSDPEIQRMMDQVDLALRDEDKESPRAQALDTVLVLDTSDSVVNSHLDELKTVAHTFIDGIEDNVDMLNLEENLAVVQMGSRAWVRQHLTNDYIRVRDAVDIMRPLSKKAPTGGKTAMFQALLVCLGAIEGKGGAVNVAGCHRVRPRLVFITDGRPTNEALEFGADTQSNISEVKFSLVQLISEFASKKHNSTPAPIFWVPIGNDPDRGFMDSLAALSGGKVVEKENVVELCKYYKMQETIGCVYKMARKHKDIYETEQHTRSIVTALAGDLTEVEMNYVIEEVKKKQKDPENETGDVDDFDNSFEDTEMVNAGVLLPLGTRVIRGPHWKWGNQDTEGAGTVVQHRKKRDGWLYVKWDNGTHNAYRFGESDCLDVQQTDDHPRILDESEMIDIGVQVRRGEDWKSGDEDGNGTGVVIRKRSDYKVKVRWENGFIGKYKYGADSKMELRIVTECLPQDEAGLTQLSTVDESEEEDELGATGGYDPSEGPPRRVWQWWNPQTKDWSMYSADLQDKLLRAYQQRQDGSCVITRDGLIRRVLFKLNQEKAVDRGGPGGGTVHVQSQKMSEAKYERLLKEEEEQLFDVD
ncbi:hypothetical protein ACOMHN_061525 [Nucella lapillus]